MKRGIKNNFHVVQKIVLKMSSREKSTLVMITVYKYFLKNETKKIKKKKSNKVVWVANRETESTYKHIFSELRLKGKEHK